MSDISQTESDFLTSLEAAVHHARTSRFPISAGGLVREYPLASVISLSSIVTFAIAAAMSLRQSETAPTEPTRPNPDPAITSPNLIDSEVYLTLYSPRFLYSRPIPKGLAKEVELKVEARFGKERVEMGMVRLRDISENRDGLVPNSALMPQERLSKRLPDTISHNESIHVVFIVRNPESLQHEYIDGVEFGIYADITVKGRAGMMSIERMSIDFRPSASLSKVSNSFAIRFDDDIGQKERNKPSGW